MSQNQPDQQIKVFLPWSINHRYIMCTRQCHKGKSRCELDTYRFVYIYLHVWGRGILWRVLVVIGGSRWVARRSVWVWGCGLGRVGAIWRCVSGERGSGGVGSGAGWLKTVRSWGIGPWCLWCTRGEVELRYYVCGGGSGGREEGGGGEREHWEYNLKCSIDSPR